MWRAGRIPSFPCASLPRRFCAGLRACALAACVSVLALTAQGCSWKSSTPAPAAPVLLSLTPCELDGVTGLWMSDDDAGRLALWIYEVEGGWTQ